MAFRTATLVLAPAPQPEQLLWRHAGARRFACNACVANVLAKLADKDQDPRPKLTWSGLDNIAYFNAFKRSAEAGVAEDGTPGLSWRHEVHQQPFEEGAKDFGRAMTRWGAYRKALKAAKGGKRRPAKVGLPKFQSRRTGKNTFRLRNNVKRTSLRLLPEGLHVSCFGTLPVTHSTGKLRRLLRTYKDPARSAYITQVTLWFDAAKEQWKATLAITWSPLVTQPIAVTKALGCDVGIRNLVTVADEDGNAVAHHLQPEQVAKGFAPLKRAQRHLGLKRLASDRKKQAEGAARRTISNSEQRAQHKFRRRHARIKNVRLAHMYALTNQLVQTHGHFGLEGLNIRGMLKNHHLAQSIASQGWGEFRWQMQYKAAWREKEVVVASVWFPSSKRCSKCGHVDWDFSAGTTVYSCGHCRYTADRDVNAANNLAWYARQDVPVYEKYSVCEKAGAGSDRAPREGMARAAAPRRPHEASRSREGTGLRSKGDTAGSPEKGKRQSFSNVNAL